MSFRAEILAAGQGGHAVVVPKDVAAAFSAKRPPVLAHVNGTEYRSRLMVYGGTCYLGLRKDLLKSIGAAAGDEVEVELDELPEPPAPEPTVVVEPRELLDALAADPAARAAYDTLPPSHRAEYARWIDEAKRAETRQDRVDRTVTRLNRN